jgi:hypothetical protein
VPVVGPHFEIAVKISPRHFVAGYFVAGHFVAGHFTHSSRRAWALLRNLGADTNITPSQNQNITANDIASCLLRISKVPMNPNHIHSTKRVLRQKRRELTEDILISDEFSVEELETALLSVKPGKAAGLDGVYPEFIKNGSSFQRHFYNRQTSKTVQTSQNCRHFEA